MLRFWRSGLQHMNCLSIWHLLPITQSRSQDTSAHCILVLEWPRKTQHNQALDGTRLCLSLTREQVRSASVVGVCPRGQVVSLVADAGYLTFTQALMLPQEDPSCLPTPRQGTDIVVRLARCHMTQEHKSILSLKQGKIVLHKMVIPAEAV